MSQRKLKITLKTPTIDFGGIISVDELVPLMSEHVPSIGEMSEALSFLDPGTMGQGTYDGTDWSLTFRTVAPEVD